MKLNVVFVFIVGFLYSVTETEACQNGKTLDGSGVNIGGKMFECKYLQQDLSDDTHEIYKNRLELCKLPTTDCCTTCKKILSCQDQPNGIYLLGMSFDCKYLLKKYPEDKKVGIYKTRHRLCNDTMTRCCQSCEILQNQQLQSVVTSKDIQSTTEAVTTTQRAVIKPTVTEAQENIDTCTDHCIWIADGSHGRCAWLTNPLKGVYKSRRRICQQNMAPGCRGTCHTVLMESQRSSTPVQTSTTQPPCTDIHLVVDKHSMDCGTLLEPSSHVYHRRKSLCKLNTTQCCKTCGRILQEHLKIVKRKHKAHRKKTAAKTVPYQRHASKRLNHHISGADNTLENFVKLYNMFIDKANTFVIEKREREGKLQNVNRVMNKMYRTVFKPFKSF